MGLLMSHKRAYNWYISCVAASCMVLYGYDASVFNSVQGSKNWLAWMNNPNAQTIGSINTAYTVGAIFGGFFLGGPCADFLGRKFGMAIGCVLVIIATFMQTFAPRHNLATFLAGRCIIGIGQGIALTAGPIYIGELAPAEIRGKIMTFWQMFYSVGSFICFWVNFACTKNVEKLGEWDWRLVVIFQLLVPTMILALLPTVPGSPRWYIQKGNNIEKAREALQRVRDNEDEVEQELLEIREAIEYEREAISSNYSALWKDKSLRKRMGLALVLNAGQQITGQGSLNSYSTKIYQKVFTSDSQIALINALNATFGIFFTLNAVWIIDRFGRKFLLIVGGIGMGICMIIVSAVETQTPQLADGSKSQPVGISIVFLMFLFIFFYKPSWGATVWIWTSEIFSMNVRAQAVGMASQTQNVANAIVQQFFPIFLENEGFYAFYMFAGINFLLAVFVWFCIPETKMVPLEEIDTLFGGANHVAQGEEVMAQQKGAHMRDEENEKADSVTVEHARS
ncbi:Major facilitator superfamily domain general substrate transporter [Penicillium cf. griseofulvum]|uniref:Major facilitator superfamily domain general substrate transporter n=1 Tax=Penicillium cf. griseofulvum TaxID=2972120 RepID=A0A9W9M4B3_9EURO|nr:Major facilitator superfamily domain general substrate transporter [Penicillium cf. griseofulvum]KAJ5434183.1 Major facilitator superfamily domain general substrate transporter [Penicillium cf. griseofulvum]